MASNFRTARKSLIASTRVRESSTACYDSGQRFRFIFTKTSRTVPAPVRLVPSRFVWFRRDTKLCRVGSLANRFEVSHCTCICAHIPHTLLWLACRDREKQSTFRQPDAYQWHYASVSGCGITLDRDNFKQMKRNTRGDNRSTFKGETDGVIKNTCAYRICRYKS